MLWFYFDYCKVTFDLLFYFSIKVFKCRGQEELNKPYSYFGKKMKKKMFSFYILIPVIAVSFLLDRNLISQSFIIIKIPLFILRTWGSMVGAWHNSKLSTVKTLVTTISQPSPSSAAIAGARSVKVSLYFFF